MRKITLILLTVLIILALSACSKSPPSPLPIDSPTIAAQAQPDQTAGIPTDLPKTLGSKPSTTLVTTQSSTSTPAFTPTASKTLAPTSTTSFTPTATEIPTSTPTKPTYALTPVGGIQIEKDRWQQGLDLLQQAGAAWVRLDIIHWDQIEPKFSDPPTYHWEYVDETMLSTISQAGLQPIMVILYSPSWALKYPGISCGPIAQQSFERFAQFMEAAVRRYSQPPFNVRYWEIGNEPDADHALVPPNSPFGCWGEANDPYYGGGYYAEMLKIIYPRIKAADPGAQVVLGGLLMNCDPDQPPPIKDKPGEFADCSSTKFFEGILINGGGDYLDVVNFHAYDYYTSGLGQYVQGGWHSKWDTTGPVITNKAGYIRRLLAQYGYPDKPLICSEIAIICGRDGSEAKCKTEEYLNTKYSYIVQSLTASYALGLKASIWYSLIGWRASGLVRPNLLPQPTLQVFNFANTMLNQSAFVGNITGNPGVKIYDFVKNDRHIWVIWSLDGQEYVFNLVNKPKAVYNVLGEIQPTTEEISVTVMPIYIEW